MTTLNRAAVCTALLVAGTGACNAAFAAGDSAAGLPQLKIETWPSQLFWLAVIFGLGYVFMSRVVTPRIGTVLEERRSRLDDDLARAREASAEAATTRAEYEASLEEARAQAAEFARKASAEALANAEAAEARAAKRMATKSARLKTSWRRPRRSREQSRIRRVRAAIAAAAQIAGVKATAAQADKAVKASAAALARQEAS